MTRFTQRKPSVESLENRQLMAADTMQAVAAEPLPVEAPDSDYFIADSFSFGLEREMKVDTEGVLVAQVDLADLQEVTIGPGAGSVGYPADDDDPDDFGPAGPVVREAIGQIASGFLHRMFEDAQVAVRSTSNSAMPNPEDPFPWPWPWPGPWPWPVIQDVDDLYISVATQVSSELNANPDPTPWNPADLQGQFQQQLMSMFSDEAAIASMPAGLATRLGMPADPDGGDEPQPLDPWIHDMAQRFADRMEHDVQVAYSQTGKPADDDNTEYPPWIAPYIHTIDDLYLVVVNAAAQELKPGFTTGQLQDHVQEQLFLWFRDPDLDLAYHGGALINPTAILNEAIPSDEPQLIRASLPGDVNHDGVFDSSDLVQVFQAGEYDDGIPQNSTFEEGDWNGDGDFDSSDLVLAFQLGHYGKQRDSSPGRVIDLAHGDPDEDWRIAIDPIGLQLR